MTKKIGVIGAGAWGTALALVAARAGYETLIWAYEQDVVEQINTNHENKLFLPGIPLPPKIRATGSYKDFEGIETILTVTPAQLLGSIAQKLLSVVKSDPLFIICSKGIDNQTGLLLSDTLRAACPQAKIGILSGPTFAKDVALDLPTTAALAVEDQTLGADLCHNLSSAHFRPLWTNDLIGTQIGGALKNIYAVGCGICTGRQDGENAKAALITQGLKEKRRHKRNCQKEKSNLFFFKQKITV